MTPAPSSRSRGRSPRGYARPRRRTRNSRHAAWPRCDQFHDEHGLAHAGAAEEAGLAALGIGGEQVNNLDAGLEQLFRRIELLEKRGGTVDRKGVLRLQGPISSTGSPITFMILPSVSFADRHRDGLPGIVDLHAAHEAVGGRHGHGPHPVLAEVQRRPLSVRWVSGVPSFLSSGWSIRSAFISWGRLRRGTHSPPRAHHLYDLPVLIDNPCSSTHSKWKIETPCSKRQGIFDPQGTLVF